MLSAGKAVKVSIYLSEGSMHHGASARIYHAWSLSFSKYAPIMVSVIDTEEQIQKLVPHLDQMISGGLVASSNVKAIRYSRPSKDIPVIG
jgi:PII-like signaling protein